MVDLAIQEEAEGLVARLEGTGASVPGWAENNTSSAFPGRLSGTSPNLSALLSKVN